MSSTSCCLVVGLTGSIGMGKSTVATHLGRHLGFRIHDADAAVHAMYRRGGAAVAPIAALFGESVLVDGSVDRPSLSRALRDDGTLWTALEAIVHPLVRADRRRFVAAAAEAGEWLVVLDVPLLLEERAKAKVAAAEECDGAAGTAGASGDGVDVVVVVSAPLEVQRERVLARPGMTPQKFDTILARQLPDAEKRAVADFIVSTNYPSTVPARSQVARMVAQLFERRRRRPPLHPIPATATAVTFDLDNTLWPTIPPIVAASAALDRWIAREMPRSSTAWRTQLPSPPPPSSLIAHDFTELRTVALAQLALANGDAADEEAARRLAARGVNVFVRTRSKEAIATHLHPDVLPALSELLARGHRLGAVTDGNAAPLGVLCAEWAAGAPGVPPAPPATAAAAAPPPLPLSFWVRAEEVGAAKPSAAPFIAASQRAGVPLHRMVHVGDSIEKDVVGALAAGACAVFLERGARVEEAAWGGAAKETPDEAVESALARFPRERWARASSLDELPAIVAKLLRESK